MRNTLGLRACMQGSVRIHKNCLERNASKSFNAATSANFSKTDVCLPLPSNSNGCLQNFGTTSFFSRRKNGHKLFRATLCRCSGEAPSNEESLDNPHQGSSSSNDSKQTRLPPITPEESATVYGIILRHRSKLGVIEWSKVMIDMKEEIRRKGGLQLRPVESYKNHWKKQLKAVAESSGALMSSSRNWTQKEDQKLGILVTFYWDQPEIKWDTIARQIGSGRTGPACKSRWFLIKSKAIEAGLWAAGYNSKYTPEEDAVILQTVLDHSEYEEIDWEQMATQLPNRSGRGCYMRWHHVLKQRAIEDGLIKSTHNHRKPYTEKESAAIISMKQELPEPTDWQLIADKLETGRTAKAVSSYWFRFLKQHAEDQGLVRGTNQPLQRGTRVSTSYLPAEDQDLIELAVDSIERHGRTVWKDIHTSMQWRGWCRTAQALHYRWISKLKEIAIDQGMLDPAYEPNRPYTQEEDDALRQLVAEWPGNPRHIIWDHVAESLGSGRSAESIMSRWHSKLKNSKTAVHFDSAENPDCSADERILDTAESPWFSNEQDEYIIARLTQRFSPDQETSKDCQAPHMPVAEKGHLPVQAWSQLADELNDDSKDGWAVYSRWHKVLKQVAIELGHVDAVADSYAIPMTDGEEHEDEDVFLPA